MNRRYERGMEVLHVPYRSELSKEVEQFFWRDVVAVRQTVSSVLRDCCVLRQRNVELGLARMLGRVLPALP